MRLRPPPALPPDLLDRFGAPDEAFGPNMRFRVASVLLGALLLLLGLAFFVIGVLGPAARGPGAGGILRLLATGLIAVGGAAVVLPIRVPRNWVFVCPRGLVRTRGAEWDGLGWAEVARFEEIGPVGG